MPVCSATNAVKEQVWIYILFHRSCDLWHGCIAVKADPLCGGQLVYVRNSRLVGGAGFADAADMHS